MLTHPPGQDQRRSRPAPLTRQGRAQLWQPAEGEACSECHTTIDGWLILDAATGIIGHYECIAEANA